MKRTPLTRRTPLRARTPMRKSRKPKPQTHTTGVDRDRDPKYLAFVRSLPSCVSGLPADDPHHLIGHGMGGMGLKSSDLLAMPLTRQEHDELHRIGWKAWEEVNGSQWKHAALTLATAVRSGFFDGGQS